MFITVFSKKVAGLMFEVSGWTVATGQAQPVVFNQGEDGPYCQVRF